ncbi:hypothetical protein DFJ73DRAFT_759471 [Zopfochytrium polystomum]|nr:hypothetical protein DFJ73DRAFT_759471 [Zopfochytrium polystomum]
MMLVDLFFAIEVLVATSWAWFRFGHSPDEAGVLGDIAEEKCYQILEALATRKARIDRKYVEQDPDPICGSPLRLGNRLYKTPTSGHRVISTIAVAAQLAPPPRRFETMKPKDFVPNVVTTCPKVLAAFKKKHTVTVFRRRRTTGVLVAQASPDRCSRTSDHGGSTGGRPEDQKHSRAKGGLQSTEGAACSGQPRPTSSERRKRQKERRTGSATTPRRGHGRTPSSPQLSPMPGIRRQLEAKRETESREDSAETALRKAEREATAQRRMANAAKGKLAESSSLSPLLRPLTLPSLVPTVEAAAAAAEEKMGSYWMWIPLRMRCGGLGGLGGTDGHIRRGIRWFIYLRNRQRSISPSPLLPNRSKCCNFAASGHPFSATEGQVAPRAVLWGYATIPVDAVRLGGNHQAVNSCVPAATGFMDNLSCHACALSSINGGTPPFVQNQQLAGGNHGDPPPPRPHQHDGARAQDAADPSEWVAANRSGGCGLHALLRGSSPPPLPARIVASVADARFSPQTISFACRRATAVRLTSGRQLAKTRTNLKPVDAETAAAGYLPKKRAAGG